MKSSTNFRSLNMHAIFEEKLLRMEPLNSFLFSGIWQIVPFVFIGKFKIFIKLNTVFSMFELVFNNFALYFTFFSKSQLHNKTKMSLTTCCVRLCIFLVLSRSSRWESCFCLSNSSLSCDRSYCSSFTVFSYSPSKFSNFRCKP